MREVTGIATNPILKTLVPDAYDVCQTKNDSEITVWFALMERVGFTWVDLVKSMCEKHMHVLNMSILCVAMLNLVKFYVDCGYIECPLFDMHGGNVGFIDAYLAR